MKWVLEGMCGSRIYELGWGEGYTHTHSKTMEDGHCQFTFKD